MKNKMEELKKFGLDPRYGFLSKTHLQSSRLPRQLHEWEDVLDNLVSLLQSNTLRNRVDQANQLRGQDRQTAVRI